MEIIYNGLQTPDGTRLRSYHVHDYVNHKDANGKVYFLDGGTSYVRCSAHEDQEVITFYDDQPHEIQRALIVWGSYGKNGDQPRRWIPIMDMETDHIEAVLRECNPKKSIKNCMKEELNRR